MAEEIECDVQFDETINDDGRKTNCVHVTCTECDRSQMSYGHGNRSIRRCLIQLKKSCGCKNWLTVPEEVSRRMVYDYQDAR